MKFEKSSKKKKIEKPTFKFLGLKFEKTTKKFKEKRDSEIKRKITGKNGFEIEQVNNGSS